MRRLKLLAVACVIAWLLSEAALYALDATVGLPRLPSVLVDDVGSPHLIADSATGSRLGRKPFRCGLVTGDGELESWAWTRTNSLGMPDDEFGPKRKRRGLRLLVLGDSFTKGDFLAESWPDLVEKRTGWDLLNFSGSGWGVWSWAGALESFVDETWDIDGVVFCVMADDLRRSAMMMWTEPMAHGWHVVAARPGSRPTALGMRSVPAEQFDRLTKGERFQPEWSWTPRGLGGAIWASRLAMYVATMRGGRRDQDAERIKAVLSRRHWPALVLWAPEKSAGGVASNPRRPRRSLGRSTPISPTRPRRFAVAIPPISTNPTTTGTPPAPPSSPSSPKWKSPARSRTDSEAQSQPWPHPRPSPTSTHEQSLRPLIIRGGNDAYRLAQN